LRPRNDFACAAEERTHLRAPRPGSARVKAMLQAIAISRLAAPHSLGQAESFAQMQLGAPRDFASL